MLDYLLTGYTIYENPRDLPGKYVMRGWVAMDGGTTQPAHETITGPLEPVVLSFMRQKLQAQGRINMGRRPEDDPVIVETWI